MMNISKKSFIWLLIFTWYKNCEEFYRRQNVGNIYLVQVSIREKSENGRARILDGTCLLASLCAADTEMILYHSPVHLHLNISCMRNDHMSVELLPHYDNRFHKAVSNKKRCDRDNRRSLRVHIRKLYFTWITYHFPIYLYLSLHVAHQHLVLYTLNERLVVLRFEIIYREIRSRPFMFCTQLLCFVLSLSTFLY